jgi:hypothetical protein
MELVSFAADPIAVGTIVGALALVMLAAAWHKFSEPEVFAGSVSAYELLPRWLVVPVARLLPWVETGLAIGVLLPVTRPAALLALTGLLLGYAAAMAVNLLRGRRDIDCGCGGATQPLSWALVARNLLLCAAALVATRPTLERSMDWVDALTLVLGVLAFYALYLMADELLRQASRMARSGSSQQG